MTPRRQRMLVVGLVVAGVAAGLPIWCSAGATVLMTKASASVFQTWLAAEGSESP